MPLDLDMLKHLSDLLHLHEKALGHPKLKAISDEAMKQLEEHAKTLEPVPEVKAETAKVEDDQGQPIDQEEAGRMRAQKAEADAEADKAEASSGRVSRR